MTRRSKASQAQNDADDGVTRTEGTISASDSTDAGAKPGAGHEDGEIISASDDSQRSEIHTESYSEGEGETE